MSMVVVTVVTVVTVQDFCPFCRPPIFFTVRSTHFHMHRVAVADILCSQLSFGNSRNQLAYEEALEM